MKIDFKKYAFYFILPIVAIIVFYGYDYLNTINKPIYNVYKPGYINDCANNVVEVSNDLDFTKLINKNNIELSKTNQDNIELYKSSFCVNKKIVSFDYLMLDQFKIEHYKGINNQIYQLSYQKILEELNKIENKNELDNKIISSINYYLNDANLIQYINSNNNYQINKPLIGPKASDEDGVYVLNIAINLVQADIFKDKEQTKLEKTIFYFDSLNLSYKKVVEHNE